MILGVKMKISLLLIGFLAHGQLFACFKVPDFYSRPYSVVISEADAILLIRVTAATKKLQDSDSPSSPSNMSELIQGASNNSLADVLYEFVVIENIKNSPSKRPLYLYGKEPQSNENSDFNEHTEYHFWLNNGGRVRTSSNCEIVPSFEVGNMYLLIENRRDSYKAYEKVNSLDDAWLQEVRLILRTVVTQQD